MNLPSKELLKCYPIWCDWNHKKSIKNFIKVYKKTFTHFTFSENPIWRIYKIFKNTISGKYEEIEKNFKKDYEKLLTNFEK